MSSIFAPLMARNVFPNRSPRQCLPVMMAWLTPQPAHTLPVTARLPGSLVTAWALSDSSLSLW